jgi:hypothetical protein
MGALNGHPTPEALAPILGGCVDGDAVRWRLPTIHGGAELRARFEGAGGKTIRLEVPKGVPYSVAKRFARERLEAAGEKRSVVACSAAEEVFPDIGENPVDGDGLRVEGNPFGMPADLYTALAGDSFHREVDEVRIEAERAAAILAQTPNVAEPPAPRTIPLGAREDHEPVQAHAYQRKDPAAIPARDWLYGRSLLRGKVTLTVAPGGVGKTALTIADALSLVIGRPLLHETVPSRSRVWLWNLEEDQHELDRRIAAACEHHEIDGDLKGLFVNTGFDSPLCLAETTPQGAVIRRPMAEAVLAELRRKRIDILIVDPFVSSHSVSENDNGAIDMVVKEWARIANAAGCAVHLVHHTHKLHGAEVSAESSRGAKALVDGARVARALNPMSREEAQGLGLQDNWRYFRVTDAKTNYAPPAEASEWFAHRSVQLANGDNVGVVERWQLPDAMKGVTVEHLDEVVRRVRVGRYREAPQSADWIGHPIAEVLEADLDDPKDRKRVVSSLKAWIRSGALKVVEERDAERKLRRFVVASEVMEVGK